MDDLKTNILSTLKYYDFFSYPLTADEILLNLTITSDISSVNRTLKLLCENNEVFQFENLYSLHNNKELSVKRISANNLANRRIRKALRLTNLLELFPFVEAAFISGSLSKNVATPDSDIDYFILTAPGKVWICRSALHLFKKLTFITSSQHNFCMNYFLDISRPEIEEQNLYTAIELLTLKSNNNKKHILNYLIASNPWAIKILPNQASSFKSNENTYQPKIISNTGFYSWLNSKLMKLTDIKWRKKWKKKGYPMQDYDTAFRTRIHVSKNHPENYLKKIISYCNESGIPA